MKTKSNESPAGGKQGSKENGTINMIPNSNDSIDFKALRGELLNQSEAICREYLSPDGKKTGHEWVSRNPTRNDERVGSFSVNLNTGKWSDFATGDKGSDLVSLVAYVTGCSQFDAARRLQKKYGSAAAVVSPKGAFWEPITPVPDGAPIPILHHNLHGKCSRSWRYVDRDGKLHGIVCRFDKADGSKAILPYTYCLNKDSGNKMWRWKGLAAPRPLYNLDKLTDKIDAIVIVAEGEKAADAAQELFGDTAVATTSMHGAQSPHKTDWSPLKDREVVIWADYDKVGEKYAEAVAQLAMQAGAKRVRVIDAEKLKPGSKPPVGWDAADALGEGVTKDKLEALGTGLFKSNKEESRAFSPFESREDGVYYNDLDPDKKPRKICSPLKIIADVCDQNDENWGRLLQITDRKGNNHQWCMPMRILSGSGEECRSNLLNLGLRIESSALSRRLLMEYVQTYDSGKMARCVKKVGWHGDAFVLPDRVLQKPGEEEVVFQPDYVLSHGIQAKGTLDDWKNHVASTCRGNSRLMLAVCVSLAPPLLHLLDVESGGIHLRGGSSIGKTTSLYLAASVWGSSEYIKNWRFTDNGIESVAAIHNHLPLLLDELAQVDARVAGDIAYMLANGQGKGRANKSGITRSLERWRLLFLSTGEVSLPQHSNTAGKRATAGQEVRILDIDADAGEGLGIFEKLHDGSLASDYALRIKAETGKYFGTAGPEFVSKLLGGKSITEKFARLRESFLKANVPMNADGQVRRAAERFIVIAFAGELATEYGITGWMPGEATKGILACFQSWIKTRGGIGSQERSEVLSQVRLFFERHGESRFTLINDEGRSEEERVPLNRAGFRKRNGGAGLEYFILPEVFKNEICAGLDYHKVTRVLREEAILLSDTQGRSTCPVRLPEVGTKRVFKITSKILGRTRDAQEPL